MKRIAVTLAVFAAIAANAQRQSAEAIINAKDAFIKGYDAALEYVQRIGYTEDIKMVYDTTHWNYNNSTDITKRVIATNPIDNSKVVLLSSVQYDNSLALHTIVFIWQKKGYKKVMPKGLPKKKQKIIWNPYPHEFYLTEDAYKHTYAISWRCNPFRPIRGATVLTPFEGIINGLHFSGSISR